MAAGCGGDLGEDGFSGAQQLFAFLRPLLAKARIEAHQQPLAGKLGTDDFRYLVGLQFAGAKFSIDFAVFLIFEQLADVGIAKRRDPIQCDRQQILADARRSNHATVADQRYFVNVEALANLADLRGHSAGVGAVAREHFNRDRTTVATDEFKQATTAEVWAYFGSRVFPGELMNALLAYMDANQVDGADAAAKFVEEHSDVWGAWVSSSAKEMMM